VSDDQRAVLLYDQDCGFCRWSLSKILAWDRGHRQRPVPLQTEEALRLLDGMSEEQRLGSWHLIAADGHRYSAGAAAAPLARLLPFGAPIALIAGALPGTTERLYRWVADHRDQLGRRLGEQACAVDPAQARNRP
jgi:predicted DCC family thiol-disulfide oxidoreductase YuxK